VEGVFSEVCTVSCISLEAFDHDERPHVCNDGWVTIGQIVLDPERCEETEEFALYLCRECAKHS
jgi:hypothetical protein